MKTRGLRLRGSAAAAEREEAEERQREPRLLQSPGGASTRFGEARARAGGLPRRARPAHGTGTGIAARRRRRRRRLRVQHRLVFHYAFECFEGMKAYKDAQGQLREARAQVIDFKNGRGADGKPNNRFIKCLG